MYFTYGMYFCMNITSGQEGDPQAVLIRSVVPADEESRGRMIQLRMQASEARAGRREQNKLQKEISRQEPLGKTGMEQVRLSQAERDRLQKGIEKHLADGPGKMCIAMGITKEHNALDMIESADFYVTEGIVVEEAQIKTGKRIGIDYAGEAADYLWRFYL